MTDDRLVDKLAAVKAGLEVFGVEKRIKELEARPQGGGRSNGGNTSGLLKLDQTTPQSVINGTPTFTKGLTIKAGQRIKFNG